MISSLLLAFDPIAFELGPIQIRWYALIIVLGIILGEWVFRREAIAKGIDPDRVFDLFFYAVIFGFIGARLYYVIFKLDYYLANPDQIIQIWHGGIAIYGGVLGAVVTLYYLCRRYGINFITVLDTAAPGLILAQAIGRWGNFMNQEAHGGPVSLEFLQKLHLPQFIIDQMLINGTYYHPTFLYESLWNLFGLLIILVIRHRPRFLLEGEVLAFYLLWYGAGRFTIEGMRTDSLYLGSLRVSQWLSLVLVIVSLIFILYRRRSHQINYYQTQL
ncbi:prolipoprotein diacylglyceryl transferase [Eremococcus coleocola]|uniref:prolipoprotein diacylglyceryl transferase n=1 Tax=Eremococcus coleocola TaxID=88132 RepID=UPI000410D9CE|nr:prolipoprotein diacylglyceryl transferase [Eremococcus coleocola]